MGRLMRLMGFICGESWFISLLPEGKALLTLAVEIYRFYSILTQAPALMVCESGPLGGYRLPQNFAKSCDFSMDRLSARTSPLLFPSGPLRMVHSSMHPKDSKRRRTSSSDCCLLSMPTKSFLSSESKRNGSRSEEQKHTHSLKEKTFSGSSSLGAVFFFGAAHFEPLIDKVNVTNASSDGKLVFQLFHFPRFNEQSYGPGLLLHAAKTPFSVCKVCSK